MAYRYFEDILMDYEIEISGESWLDQGAASERMQETYETFESALLDRSIPPEERAKVMNEALSEAYKRAYGAQWSTISGTTRA